MRLVVATDPGVVEFNWLWVPTIIGMNSEAKNRLEKKISPMFVGMKLTEKILDEMHSIVLEEICQEFNYVKGLKEYLQALHHVALQDPG